MYTFKEDGSFSVKEVNNSKNPIKFNILRNNKEKEVKEIVNPYSWPENYYMETRPEKRKEIFANQIRFV